LGSKPHRQFLDGRLWPGLNFDIICRFLADKPLLVWVSAACRDQAKYFCLSAAKGALSICNNAIIRTKKYHQSLEILNIRPK
jgi:hypothetical protein